MYRVNYFNRLIQKDIIDRHDNKKFINRRNLLFVVKRINNEEGD
jgi:hypothetical protein